MFVYFNVLYYEVIASFYSMMVLFTMTSVYYHEERCTGCHRVMSFMFMRLLVLHIEVGISRAVALS